MVSIADLQRYSIDLPCLPKELREMVSIADLQRYSIDLPCLPKELMVSSYSSTTKMLVLQYPVLDRSRIIEVTSHSWDRSWLFPPLN